MIPLPQFHDSQDALPCVPLPQSREFARALALLGAPLRRREAGGVTWQARERRAGIAVISRGPVGAEADRHAWLASIARHQPGTVLLEADGFGPEALRQAGFWPLVTPASLAMLPLGDNGAMRAAMHQKWRNRLVRAERAGLQIIRKPLERGHWLLGADAAQARARGYRPLPHAVSVAFAQANPGGAVVFEARKAGLPVAAILVLRHGAMATWQTGHATPSGRRLNAMNLLLWHAMTALAEDCHAMLDLGLVNGDDAPGIARFKLGTGARLHRLSGSWLRFSALAPVARRLPLRLAG
ncbi:GNAT family N-acetyltransferase [Citreimonas salinaria]|uniref:Acetyltransferase (GNAT) domain-containing protein n=1 Tax=Citreimonas salinaria TaxID=321339 RepID=A0A1H3GXR8_9RHOB|nr:GNAT family N-acetyltransferase [Citreimonas salinaria]SDY08113.1 Acetyltransferase (GNAT) domain-containing protein [Citreimonas salinaria]